MKTESNINMGNRIQAARERAGMTREKFAEYIEVTPRFVYDFETGRVGISLPTLKKICEVLSISSDSLLWDKTTQAGIDEKLKFVDEEYIQFIDKAVQAQLDLIQHMKQKDTKSS